MSGDLDKSIIYLTEVEKLGQDILTQKETKLQLSNAQNKFREAYRALQDCHERKTWLKVGSVYVQLPVEECRGILKEEIDKVTIDIDNLYENIKDNVSKLRDLEHLPGIEGFRLKPMTGKEADAIHKAYGFK
ncbi:p53 and DNA damage-regulated protein 1 [Onthophagus taurus]|uniref:p53 and DNA damage-regulated protein 1 n=1 Tax=Onthophagus taurus TaxID=166361 RepID=UPI000C2095AF|nr:uncharacterized protein LOC111428597 [Onthophagus taurus]